MSVSIVIPTYNHAAYLGDAIRSALAQTVPCEVVVVDDGSTDETDRVLSAYTGRVRVITLAHGGPAKARNVGIEAATSEFLMFLDADDVLHPEKAKRQVDAFSEMVGWVLCDVRIEDEARGYVRLASEQYRYADRHLGGWVREQLAASNFVPIMAPLVRRSVLMDHGVRFSDALQPEDWHFWYAVAGHARMRYIPDVLATYRHRRSGRSRLGLGSIAPATDGPIRLNLGCGTPGSRSWHPMRGLINLDRSMGWLFEDGLEPLGDGSVAGITISHALMYVHELDWPRVVAEFARVLAPGAVIRITEDDTEHPESSRRGGWKGSEPAVTLTSPAFVRRYLEAAGLEVFDVGPAESKYRDGSLCQQQHGDPPDVFFIEGVKR